MLSSASNHCVSSEEHLTLIFRALGDQTRRELLARLAEGPAMITELADPFDMSLPAVSKHLRTLEKAGLVERSINGRVHRCALNALPLRNAVEWLSYYKGYWRESLDALSEYFENGPDRR